MDPWNVIKMNVCMYAFTTSILSQHVAILNHNFRLITKMMETGLKSKSIHLIGHSLGAHICSYIASHLGGVARITG
jgi:triacylglycerol esterase/lipase EstA (alpha/beta hydrolase family)